MQDNEQVHNWLLKTIQLVVDCPEDVVIETELGDKRTTFRIKANPGDIGKVIGKQGRTSQSLRVIVRAMARKLDWQFVVDIEENGISRKSPSQILD
jgi:predicted RNA-binding protein YlqC (UPF0109 family)